MDIIELLLDENDELTGIEAVSIVENPAIESDFIALSKQEVKFAKVDEDKKILMGAALIPNKPIFRKRNDTMFYVYFSKDTVKRASELFFMNGNQNNATLEHNMEINGLTVVESWIVENPEMDKSKMYGFEVPEGTWMISMKVENDEVWNDYVKEGKVKGFSIEGYFADKAKIQKPNLKAEMQAIEEEEAEYMLSNIKAVIRNDKRTKNGKKITLETYKDYPQGATNNAKRMLEWREKYGRDVVKGGTRVGWERANQLASREALSLETVKRVHSFLSRHEENAKIADEYRDEPWKDKGYVAYNLWGGKAMVSWAKRIAENAD